MKEFSHINNKKNGYKIKYYSFPTKRYCQTLELKDDEKLINEYKKRHSKEFYWKEVGDGIRSVGILEMEIYLLETHLFMIVETTLDFEWDSAFAKLSELPRQKEWEEYMSLFQMVEKTAVSADKWQLMERIFVLP